MTRLPWILLIVVLNKLDQSAALTGTNLCSERLCLQWKRMNGCSVVNSCLLTVVHSGLQRVYLRVRFHFSAAQEQNCIASPRRRSALCRCLGRGWEEGQAQGVRVRACACVRVSVCERENERVTM